MAGFAVEDMFLKSAGVSLPAAEVMVLFGAGGAAVFALLALARGETVFPRAAFGRTMAVRTAFEVMGRLFYTLAIVLTPLSSATAILQATPIVVVAGAALVFGEQVGWRRWTAILIGLAGVMIILRPGAESFTPLSILAVLGLLGFAGRDLATRAAPKVLGTAALGVWGFLSIVAAGLIYRLFEGVPFVLPAGSAGAYMALAVVFGVSGYASLTLAMRTGDVSAVTPFRYSRLLFGITLGVVVFGETLDTPTIVGSLIVVLSGLYILARGRRAVTAS
ncbi:DMT family transporter [Kangsaoukella pontilimi]